jgi:quinol monooxygenase YgiN
MVIVKVELHVKPDQVDAFLAASIANGQGARQEPGNIRFDLLQEVDDPTRFVLIEVYQSPEDQQAHSRSPHFKTWWEATIDMFVDRSAKRFTAAFPPEADW